jgi:diguanylate cyclase (GGDEF)-like protein
MSELADHLANLTGFRDRDLLDLTLVSAFKDLLQPLSVAIYRCIGEPEDLRWITRARVGPGDEVPTADPGWAELADLPRLADHPERLQALDSRDALLLPGPPHRGLFPIASDREVAAVLELETEQPLDAANARLVGSVLRLYRNFQSLLDYSERDTLTGLLNRKTFDESFMKASIEPPLGSAPAQAGRRARGPAGSHWLAVIDIDHFKRVNDGFGHLIGDEVLLLLSRLMRGSFRVQDHLYRFGGEEFVVLMRCGSAADAKLALERLRTRTAGYAFPQIGHITVSIGFTELRPGDTPNSAFERADKAVYHAKEHGRNQVCSHADLVASGVLQDAEKVSDVELF